MFAAGALASCAGESVLDAAEDRERRGAPRDRAAAQAKDRVEKPRKPSATKVQETSAQQDNREPGARTAPSGGTQQGSAPESNDEGRAPDASPSKAPPKPAESCASDLARDMDSSGGAPSYADQQRGCVREDGTRLAL